MINITQEETFPLAEAAKFVPKRHGRKVHFSTLWRWQKIGVRGVRLEVVRIGGALCTSREAVQRFVERLSEGQQQSLSANTRTMNQRQRSTAKADAELAASGW